MKKSYGWRIAERAIFHESVAVVYYDVNSSGIPNTCLQCLWVIHIRTGSTVELFGSPAVPPQDF